MAKPSLLIRNLVVWIFRRLGTRVVDRRTGKVLGPAFFIGWNGRIVAIGLENEPALKPEFLPQETLTYWKQEIGFSSHPHPDFPKIEPNDPPRSSDPSSTS